jgi:hypothetical protein
LAPPVRAARDRSVLVVALLLVAGQLVLRGWLVAQRHYFADDLRLLHLADTSALLSPSYLLTDFDGHLMPGAFLVAGIVERAGPLEWWPAAVSLVVLQALASLALLRLLRVLLGERPLLLVPLAFGLFTPVALGSLTWWAAALNSIPLQIGLAWYVADAVLLARTGRRRYALTGTAALAFTFAFYLKAVLLPPVALAVVAVVLLHDRVRSPLVAAVRRGWALWLGTVVVVAVWAVTYLSTRDQDPVAAGQASDVVVTVRTGFRALTPAVLSAPFDWLPFPPGTPLSNPSTWSVAVAAAVLLAAFLWTCVRRRGALAVWLLTAVVIGAGLLMAALGRSSLGLGHIVPLAYRYFAAEAVLLPLAGALLALLPLRERFRPGLDAPSRPARRPATAVAALLTACFVAAAVHSTVDHARAWEGDPTAAYLDTARASLAAAGPAPLLDQTVPSYVMWEQLSPHNVASRVFSPLPDRPDFALATDKLQLLDDTGRLVPARVQPWVRATPGPLAGCGYPVPGEGSAALTLDGPLPDRTWTAQLDVIASRDGVLTVALDDGEPVAAPVAAGLTSVFVRLTGPASELRVGTTSDGLGACVTGAAIGWVVL